MATHRHTRARQNSTLSGPTNGTPPAGRDDICGASASGMIVTTTSTAAAANHFNCSRSSPDDRTNLVTSAAPATTVAAGHSTTSAECKPGYHPWLCGANGSRHTRLARATKPRVSSAYTAATNQAAGRQRRDGSSPAGNSRSTNARAPAGTIQIQFTSHSAARAPGIGPGRAAISPYHPYAWLKKPSPSSRPVASKIQPILFAGRRDASTKPTTGTAMNVSTSKTSGKFHRPAVATCRPRYASGSPPNSSAIDNAATPPVTQRRARGVIRASSAIRSARVRAARPAGTARQLQCGPPGRPQTRRTAPPGDSCQHAYERHAAAAGAGPAWRHTLVRPGRGTG